MGEKDAQTQLPEPISRQSGQHLRDRDPVVLLGRRPDGNRHGRVLVGAMSAARLMLALIGALILYCLSVILALALGSGL